MQLYSTLRARIEQSMPHYGASGFTAITGLGTVVLFAGVVAVVLAVLWALLQLATLLFTSVLAAVAETVVTFQNADPDVRLISILVIVVLVVLAFKARRSK